MHKAYGGTKQIAWLEVLAGEKAFNKTGQWLPAETLVRRGKGKSAREKVQLTGLTPAARRTRSASSWWASRAR